MVKRKPGFRELEPALKAAVARGAVAVPEAETHRIESAARPDLPVLELLHELSRGLRLPDPPGARERQLERRLAGILERDFPQRSGRAATGWTCGHSRLRSPAAGSRHATRSWPTSSAGAACTFASAASSTPGAAPMSTACGSGSSSCRRTRMTVRRTRSGARARRWRGLRAQGPSGTRSARGRAGSCASLCLTVASRDPPLSAQARRAASRFPHAFENGNRASLVAADAESDPAGLFAEVGLGPEHGRPVVVVFGGADTLSGESQERAAGVVGPGVVRGAQIADAVITKGDTGRARRRNGPGEDAPVRGATMTKPYRATARDSSPRTGATRQARL
jgi:hypothetical protein